MGRSGYRGRLLHAYPEKLCLLQVGVPGGEYLVDPLADLHLEPLWDAMDGHSIIFHAADYDLRLLFRGHHFKPARIFDTMLAARLVGEARFGLNDALNTHLGITLEKGSQGQLGETSPHPPWWTTR